MIGSAPRDNPKTILITGASSGIGAATADFLSKKGFTVYGTSRNEQSGDASLNFNMLVMDVTQPVSVTQAVNEILQEEGQIDVLINCAGAGISGPLEEISEEEMNWQMDVNFFGYLRTIQAVLPEMRIRGTGLIINISSLGGRIGLPFQGLYSASKFAVEGFSEALEKELAPFGISVVVVQPGDIATAFTGNRIFNGKNGNQSPYDSIFRKTIAVIEKDENNGLSPVRVARKIYRIINSRKPRHIHVVAAWDQILAAYIKKFLPASLFSWIIRDHYRVRQW